MKARWLSVAALCGLVLGIDCVCTPEVWAITNSWIGGDGQWEDAPSWTLGAAPNITEDVEINATSPETVTLDDNTVSANPSSLSMQSLYLHGPGGGTLELFNTGTNYPIFVQNGVTLKSPLTLDLIGPTTLILGTNAVGSGPSHLDSIVHVAPLGILYGGWPELFVNGNIVVAGGTLVHTNGAGNLHVGSGSNGLVTVSNGLAVAKSLFLGEGGGSGTLTVAGGTVKMLASLLAGNASSTGRVNVTGGTIATTSEFVLGAAAPSIGAAWVSGGEIDVTNADTAVGDLGAGTLTLSNGIWRTCNMILGRSGGTGTLNVEGGALLVTNCSVVDVRNGTFTLDTGTVAVTTLLVTNANGHFNLNGGQLTVTTATVSNGQGFIVGSNALYQAGAGVQSFGSGLRIRTNGTVTSCGTINGDVTVDSGGLLLVTCGGTLTVTGIVTNNGSITASGGSTLSFSGPVVNNGFINATNGSAQFLSSVINNGTILTNFTYFATNQWLGGSGKWETATNWSAASAPSIADGIDLITSLIGAPYTVTLDATTAGSFSGTLTISNLVLGGVFLNTNTLMLSNAGLAAPLHVLNSCTISTRGSLVITNSAVEIGRPVIYTPSNNNFVVNGTGASVTLQSGSLIATNVVAQIGDTSAGVITINDGTFLGRNIIAGYHGGNGTLTVNGGTFEMRETAESGVTFVLGGTNGTGAFWVNGGQVNLTNNFTTFIGGETGSGQMTVSNGNVRLFDLFVGAASNAVPTNATMLGNVTLAGGTTEVTAIRLSIGYNPYSRGTVLVNGGTLIVTNVFTELLVGGGGVGDLIISNGLVMARHIALATNAVTGVGLGRLTLAGGQLTITGSNTLVIGGSSSVASTMNISSGVLDSKASPVIVGDAGVGNLTLGNGTATALTLTLGAKAGGNGSMVLNQGASCFVSSNMTVGNCDVSGVGTVSISGGTLAVTNATHTAVLKVRYGSLSIASNATLLADVLVMTDSCTAQFLRSPGAIVTVGTAILDPNGDADGDGLLNGWEQSHGLDPLDPNGINGASGDPDGDHINNYTEYLLGTDPRNASDPFRVTDIHREGNDIHVTWQFYAGFPPETFKLDVADNLAFSNSFVAGGPVVINFLNGIISTNQLDVGGATNSPAHFYRVRWENPP